MNQKVEELGLKGTHFDNVTGLHSENNYSTAYDIAVILNAAMKNELCRKVLSTYQHTTEKTPQNPKGILLSSTLFTYMYGTEPETATILGGKTGFVNESGYCIASYGKGNESQKEYIVVTMGNSARWPAFYGQIDLYKQYAK
jgi:D-alanyl-D-alanine carboxypeptidase (penicillin-binding protein 5/6)